MTAHHRHGPLRTLLWVLAIGGLMLSSAGCGLSADEEPQVIQAEDLPSDLLVPATTATTTTLVDGATAAVPVYLIVREGDVNRLSAVSRDVTDPGRAGPRIDALLKPTSPQEQQRGLSSSIPSDTVLLGTTLVQQDSELIVNLSGALFDIQGKELAQAFAQLVWTVTELDGVRQVRFKVDGEAYRAPNAEGIEQAGAVTRSDYLALAPQ